MAAQHSAQPILIKRNDYSSTNVTTAAYVELVASLASNVSMIDIYDSSGEFFVLAVGEAGSESDVIYIPQGGNGRIFLTLSAGQRVSIKAVSANATVGDLLINFWGGR